MGCGTKGRVETFSQSVKVRDKVLPRAWRDQCGSSDKTYFSFRAGDILGHEVALFTEVLTYFIM